MRRRDLRKSAFNLLFQIKFTDDIEKTKDIFFNEMELDITQPEKDFIVDIVYGVIKNIDEIDEIINKLAKRWNTKSMPSIDVTILRLAIYEIKFCNETPRSVVINEAIEIAKEYSLDNSPSFINGILGNVV